MAKFIIAHAKTAINEGGYTNNPDDNGNWTGGKKGVGVLIGTNRGVSAPVLAKYLGTIPTVSQMKMLSENTAQYIYRINYWDVMRGDDWVNQENANAVYDMCVNAGCRAAISLWQSALGIKEPSGRMDDFTLQKTNLKS